MATHWKEESLFPITREPAINLGFLPLVDLTALFLPSFLPLSRSPLGNLFSGFAWSMAEEKKPHLGSPEMAARIIQIRIGRIKGQLWGWMAGCLYLQLAMMKRNTQLVIETLGRADGRSDKFLRIFLLLLLLPPPMLTLSVPWVMSLRSRHWETQQPPPPPPPQRSSKQPAASTRIITASIIPKPAAAAGGRIYKIVKSPKLLGYSGVRMFLNLQPK